jgi:protein-S-isoprenylcysteine O-methyltransferase Ste14
VERRLSRWGVGPRIAVPSLLYTFAARAATSAWPDIFRLAWLPSSVVAVGAVLIAIGLAMWIAAGISVMRAYNRDELVTSGVFALVRHPLYASWIALVFPGIALVLRSWPMLLTPFLGWLIFRRLIHREDEYLERRFGKAYLDYCRRVNEVIPIPRFKSLL